MKDSHTSPSKIKVSWSNMENMKYANKDFCIDTQITYKYAAETTLTDGDKILANVERWSCNGNKWSKSHSIYHVFIWLNGQPKLFGKFADTTLKECKKIVIEYLQNNH